MKLIAKKIVNPHSIIQNRAVPVKGHCQVSFRNPKTGKLLKTKSYRISEKGWEDPLEKGMATHSSILAWRISWTEGAWWATVHGVAESDMVNFHFYFSTSVNFGGCDTSL